MAVYLVRVQIIEMLSRIGSLCNQIGGLNETEPVNGAEGLFPRAIGLN